MATATASPPSGTTAERSHAPVREPVQRPGVEDIHGDVIRGSLGRDREGLRPIQELASRLVRGARGDAPAQAELCRQRRDDLARLMAIDMGKRSVEGRAEVDLCAGSSTTMRRMASDS